MLGGVAAWAGAQSSFDPRVGGPGGVGNVPSGVGGARSAPGVGGASAGSTLSEPGTSTSAVPTGAGIPAGSGVARPRYTLNGTGEWTGSGAPAPGSDEEVVSTARRMIAENRPDEAKKKLDAWLKENESRGSALVPAALLARGDAQTLAGDEFDALYDYEQIIKIYPAAAEYPIAVERELEIGIKYVSGTRREWFFGWRILNAEDVGEELLVRVQERMPGARVAERAGIELADHFYRNRELKLASTAYEMFLLNYKLSPYRVKAMQRRIYANIARFKGPRYDGSALVDATVLIKRFMSLYPAEAQKSGLDESLLTRIDETAGLQMLEVAAWYLRTGDDASARYTLKRLIRAHPQSAACQRAIEQMKARGWEIQDFSPAPIQRSVSGTGVATVPVPESEGKGAEPTGINPPPGQIAPSPAGADPSAALPAGSRPITPAGPANLPGPGPTPVTPPTQPAPGEPGREP